MVFSRRQPSLCFTGGPVQFSRYRGRQAETLARIQSPPVRCKICAHWAFACNLPNTGESSSGVRAVLWALCLDLYAGRAGIAEPGLSRRDRIVEGRADVHGNLLMARFAGGERHTLR